MPVTHEQFEERAWTQIKGLKKQFPGQPYGWAVLNALYSLFPNVVAAKIGTPLDPSHNSRRVNKFIETIEEEVCGARPLEPQDAP